MKTVRKLFAILLIACTLMCCLISPASAKSPEGTSVGTCSFADPGFEMVDLLGNRYGRANWPNFEAAKKYYGVNLEYHSCSCFSGGLYFNYYYLMDEGYRMYFGVIG